MHPGTAELHVSPNRTSGLTVAFYGSRVTRSSGKRRNWGLWRGVGNFGILTHGMRPFTIRTHYNRERRRI